MMNSYDTVVHLLGDSGKDSWSRSEILDILSAELHIEKKDANSRFTNSEKRTDYFEKISDNPATYKFTRSGKSQYETIRKLYNANDDFRNQLRLFLDGEYSGRCYWDDLQDLRSELFVVDYTHLREGIPEVAENLLKSPKETLESLNKALANLAIVAGLDFTPKISIINAADVLQVEDLKTKHLGRFFSVEGRVVVQTLPKSKLILASYQCLRCNHVMTLPQDAYGVRTEPFECENDVCGRKGQFRLLDPPESEFIDYQDVILVSLKGEVTIKVHLTESLCQPPWVRDAKVIRVCGTMTKVDTVSRQGTKLNTFDWVIEANSIVMAEDTNTEPPTEDEKAEFERWAKNPKELRRKILDSIAPNVHGLHPCKDACSLSLFSDWHWKDDPRNVVERSSIHVNLFGDPGTAKSMIAKDVVYLAPKGKWGQIINMSRGGLTTVAVQEQGEWRVKSGFFSQGDQGVTGLDEIDKMQSKEDIVCLVSVLNDQIQLVSKIGKNDIPFNTRTAVIATENPKGGYIDPDEPVLMQLEKTIPMYIIQRFDFIFVVRDIPNPESDAIIADRINEIHADPKIHRDTLKREIPPELFRKYVMYARSKDVPIFEHGVQKMIKDYFLHLREKSKNEKYPLIGFRQVNDINRIARAIARRELSAIITSEHVRYAISLMRASLATIDATLDIDGGYGAYNIGSSKSQIDKIALIKDVIRKLKDAREEANVTGDPEVNEIAAAINEDIDMPTNVLGDYLEKMKEGGLIIQTRSSYRVI